MDNAAAPITAAGLTVESLPLAYGGALRYFDAAATSRRLEPLLGAALPAAGRLRQSDGAAGGGSVLLAWRSPSETLLLADGPAPLERLAAALAGATDACWVDQTGGLAVLSLRGSRADDLLLRLGSPTVLPPPGQVTIGRLADLTVMSLCTAGGERLLCVDRVHAEHLQGWIRATAADF